MMKGSRTIKEAIKDEAGKYCAKVRFWNSTHPMFELTFPNGESRKSSYASSPANIDDEAQFARQKVRRLAKSADALISD